MDDSPCTLKIRTEDRSSALRSTCFALICFFETLLLTAERTPRFTDTQFIFQYKLFNNCVTMASTGGESAVEANLISTTNICNQVKLSTFTYVWRVPVKPLSEHEVLEGIQLETPGIRTSGCNFYFIWKLFYHYKYQQSVPVTRGPLQGQSTLLYKDEISFKLESYYIFNDDEIEIQLRLIYSSYSSGNLSMAQKKIEFDRISPTSSYANRKIIQNGLFPFGRIVPFILLRLEIEVAEPIKTVAVLYQLSDDLEIVSKNESLSDVTFVVGEKEFKLHKLMLIARSPVFAKMLTCDMLEKKTNIVEIKDMEAEVFEELLSFLYCGKMSSDSDLVKMGALLIAADKYSIDELKKFCEKNIIANINIDTAAEILIVADLVKSENLKREAMELIFANRDKVIETESYKEMIKTHLYLVEELFRKVEIKSNNETLNL